MSKSDLLKDSMKGGLDGLLSPTKKSTGGKQPVAAPTEKETAVHCNFIINKSIHNRMKFLAIKKNMSLKDIVNEAMKGKYPLPLVETAGGVTVVPSCLDLSAAEAELINEPGRELILSGLIAKSLDHRKFDYILIDCPPSLGLLTLNALTAADYLIIPVQAQFLAMRGMAKIMNVIATVQERLNPKLAIGGIVITQFDKRKTLNKSVAELVKDSFCDKVFKTVIRDNVSLAEAPIKGKNIFEYSKNSNGAKDYMALAQEVLKLK